MTSFENHQYTRWQRSSTNHTNGHRERKVKIPVINTYNNELEKCSQMYNNMVEKIHRNSLPVTNNLRKFNTDKTNTSRRSISVRSAPVCNLISVKSQNHSMSIKSQVSRYSLGHHAQMDSSTSTLASQMAKDFGVSNLQNELEKRGFGKPSVLTISYTLEPKRICRSGKLTKIPSHREKVKGKARLEYEMANKNALAFCEQYSPRVFRTASAHMATRDIQFIEQEQKEMYQQKDVEGDSIGGGSGANDEELFIRINNWISDVEKSLGHHRVKQMDNTGISDAVRSLSHYNVAKKPDNTDISINDLERSLSHHKVKQINNQDIEDL